MLDDAGTMGEAAIATPPRPIRVIFVCTGNSARSQMAEALLRHDGGDRFEVVSAGVNPRGVHPLAIAAWPISASTSASRHPSRSGCSSGSGSTT